MSQDKKNVEDRDAGYHAELVNMAMNIIRKNEALRALSKKIDSYRANPKFQSCAAELFEMQKMINQTLWLDKDRDVFELFVKEKSELFFIRLRSLYPGLSAAEQRLAALIRLGFSSKEMASLLNISVKSVEMNRYRLRKKMQLGKQVNLAQYISKI